MLRLQSLKVCLPFIRAYYVAKRVEIGCADRSRQGPAGVEVARNGQFRKTLRPLDRKGRSQVPDRDRRQIHATSGHPGEREPRLVRRCRVKGMNVAEVDHLLFCKRLIHRIYDRRAGGGATKGALRGIEIEVTHRQVIFVSQGLIVFAQILILVRRAAKDSDITARNNGGRLIGPPN